MIDESFPAVDLSNRNYRILGSLWNLSVRTRPTGTLRNGAAPGGPTVCVSCGAAAFSSLFVVRHMYTHVSPIVPPTFPNVTFSRCLVTNVSLR